MEQITEEEKNNAVIYLNDVSINMLDKLDNIISEISVNNGNLEYCLGLIDELRRIKYELDNNKILYDNVLKISNKRIY